MWYRTPRWRRRRPLGRSPPCMPLRPRRKLWRLPRRFGRPCQKAVRPSIKLQHWPCSCRALLATPSAWTSRGTAVGSAPSFRCATTTASPTASWRPSRAACRCAPSVKSRPGSPSPSPISTAGGTQCCCRSFIDGPLCSEPGALCASAAAAQPTSTTLGCSTAPHALRRRRRVTCTPAVRIAARGRQMQRRRSRTRTKNQRGPKRLLGPGAAGPAGQPPPPRSGNSCWRPSGACISCCTRLTMGRAMMMSHRR
mmetsp:Transcript_87782/g.146522  ORF Transcript_87782/g.146522 Transcript_87782/m.146522 type:complete len:253 (-) Transcript_87782:599-1357(-)